MVKNDDGLQCQDLDITVRTAKAYFQVQISWLASREVYRTGHGPLVSSRQEESRGPKVSEGIQ